MKKVIVIQHCQSEHHVNDLTGGWTDTPLTTVGKNQASHLAQRIINTKDIEKYKIYTSDLLRAKETAEIINGSLHLPFMIDKRLREINNGDAAWKTKEWAQANRNPQTSGKFDIDLREYTNGETWREFFMRISDFMQTLCLSGSEYSILVTHGCALNYIIAWWMHFDFTLLERSYFSANPGSVSMLSTNLYGQHALILLNCTKHLR